MVLMLMMRFRNIVQKVMGHDMFFSQMFDEHLKSNPKT